MGEDEGGDIVDPVVDRSNAIAEPEPRWSRPNGPWLLASLGAVALGIAAWGWAANLPADPRWYWLSATCGLVAAGGLVGASRRRPDRFASRWPATTVAVVALVGLATFLSLPIGEGTPAVVLLFLLPVSMVAGPGCVLIALGWGLAHLLVGRRWDGGVAIAVVVGVYVTTATFDPVVMRLQGPAGDRLAAEAEALAADGTVEPVTGQPRDYPAVLAGTGRRVVVWQLSRFDTQTPLLVHDPDGVVDPADPPGGMDDCEHLTGVWWECAFG